MQVELIYTIIIAILALTTFAGLPGPFMISIATLIYGLQTHFEVFTVTHVVVFIIVGILSMGLDNILALVGAKKFGASKYGIIGATLGFLAIFALGPFGIVLGPLIGAFIGEIAFAKKPAEQSARAAVGTMIGIFTSIIAKSLIAVVLAIWFVVLVF